MSRPALRTSGLLFLVIPAMVGLGLALRLLFTSPDGLAWDQQIIDMGVLAANQDFSTTFNFRNNTRHSVTLVTEACCGVQASIQPSTVGPGDSGEVRLTGQTPTFTHNIEKKAVEVRVKELPDYRHELQIWYAVHPSLHPVPPEIGFDALEEGAMAKTHLRVYLDPGASKCTAVEVHNPRLKVRESGVKPGDYQDFEIMLTCPPKQHNDIETSFEIHTADTVYPQLTIPVRAQVRPCAKVTPDSIRLREFSINVPQVRTLVVNSRKSLTEVEVLEAPEWLSATLRRRSSSSVSIKTIAVAKKPGAVSGALKLRVITDHTFDVAIPYTGFAE